MTRFLSLIIAASLLLTGCGGGGGGTTATTTTPSSSATAVIQTASGLAVNPMTHAMQAVVGRELQLSGSGSTDTGSTISSYQWTVTTRPSGSTATPTNANSATVSFTPDAVGSYVLQLVVTDAQGQTSTQTLTFTVTDTPPTTSVVTHVLFTNNQTTSQPAQQVDIGSVITLDASGSTPSGSETLTVNWTLTNKPATSTATLPATGSIVHFTADVAGEYDVRVVATDPTGAYDEVDYVFQASPPPSAIVVANVVSPANPSGSINTFTNYLVQLDGSSSSVASGDQSNVVWSLSSRPTGSTVQLSALGGLTTTFVPDIAGNYVVKLSVTDTTTGLNSTFTMTVQVRQGPVAVIAGSTAPVAQASGPAFTAAVGEAVILRGDGSYETGGTGALTYYWQIATRPSGSTAAVVNATSVDASFTPDVTGVFVIKLTVTDAAGAAAVSTVDVQVGSFAPIAVISQPQVAVVLGSSITDSAALSYDPNGLPLTYSWSIDSRPTGSTATITGATNTASLSFTPDVAGTYTISVTVNNGSLSGVGELTISAFTASSSTVPLTYQPLLMKYNRTIDKLVLIGANPNALHIVDLNAATDLAVALPAAVKDLSVSPDGTRAAVLHEGVVSVVDLTQAKLLNSWATDGSQTFVVISNAGLIYLGGQTGGQWVSPGVSILNANTGATIQAYNGGSFYGTMSATYADASNQIFVVSFGLSPVQTYSVALDPTTGQVTGTTGSPYWGTYGMGGPMWLSSDESLLFTAAGTYYSTNGITYVNTLGLTGQALSISNDTAKGEAVALTETTSYSTYPFTYTYSASYQLYTGSLLFPQGSMPLPMLAGAQTYGLAMFHSSTGRHVMVVQTGTAAANGAGAQYFALLR